MFRPSSTGGMFALVIRHKLLYCHIGAGTRFSKGFGREAEVAGILWLKNQ